MTGDADTPSNEGDELAATRRDIVAELTNAYCETYRYERPNDSVAELTAFCRDLAENEVDKMLELYANQTLDRAIEQASTLSKVNPSYVGPGIEKVLATEVSVLQSLKKGK